MAGGREHKRILIYSHDSFGLGHLRRCRAIAHSLVEADSSLSVLILSGSPIIGSFDFRSRVDFVRIPGVIKLRNGEYVSLNLHIDIEETLAMRSSIIRHTAEIFDPDMLIVDKEPLGLRGEVRPTLDLLRARGTPLVLGLRDVMDEPSALESEWERKNAIPALSDYYNEIWVYGLPQICDPLAGLHLPASVRRRMVYTGYLHRNAPAAVAAPEMADLTDGEFLLATAGGGGDGDGLIDWVLSAYEHDPGGLPPMVLVFGPFMLSDLQAAFAVRAARLPKVSTITFDTRLETLMTRAAGIIAMGGYNTFCEILSFDKPALIVPRTMPRMEQFIRAQRAAELGLVAILSDDGGRDPKRMAAALLHLAQQPRPSTVVIPGLLDGMASVNRLTQKWLALGRGERLRLRLRARGNA
ncbi:MAG TPA: glycosyltransferase [Stellaceae bacterium]|jgi:predicted glycosyltransferase|nr:glycosyltransferase [Stellaceae bacterium]